MRTLAWYDKVMTVVAGVLWALVIYQLLVGF